MIILIATVSGVAANAVLMDNYPELAMDSCLCNPKPNSNSVVIKLYIEGDHLFDAMLTQLLQRDE